jgi:hypothetical protein
VLAEATVIKIERCLACDSQYLLQVLDLGSQPLANEFLVQPVEQDTYPLKLNYCENCSHLQLSHSVDRRKIFDDYLYVSGTTETLRADFKEFAEYINSRFPKGLIVDIACNDGSQLDEFKKLGWKTLGIDPATNLFKISSKNHIVIQDYLRNGIQSFLQADLTLAQNVVAHTDNPSDFVRIASEIAPINFYQTSQANMITRGEFDTIYHEHISFFSERSFFELARRSGTKLTNVSMRKIHGTSFLFQAGVGKEITQPELVKKEEVLNFGFEALSTISQLRQIILVEKSSGRIVIGYGAAAKGMTVLNAVNVKIDFLVDDSPLKIGRYSPGLHIPIIGVEKLRQMDKPITIILTAWNFEKEIRERIAKVYSGPIKFVKYFPNIEIS